jgi:hypothetical protein
MKNNVLNFKKEVYVPINLDNIILVMELYSSNMKNIMMKLKKE